MAKTPVKDRKRNANAINKPTSSAASVPLPTVSRVNSTSNDSAEGIRPPKATKAVITGTSGKASKQVTVACDDLPRPFPLVRSNCASGSSDSIEFSTSAPAIGISRSQSGSTKSSKTKRPLSVPVPAAIAKASRSSAGSIGSTDKKSTTSSKQFTSSSKNSQSSTPVTTLKPTKQAIQALSGNSGRYSLKRYSSKSSVCSTTSDLTSDSTEAGSVWSFASNTSGKTSLKVILCRVSIAIVILLVVLVGSIMFATASNSSGHSVAPSPSSAVSDALPTPSLRPTALQYTPPVLSKNDEIHGFWAWSWLPINPGRGVPLPPNINLVVAFSGWSQLEHGWLESTIMFPYLPTSTNRYFSVGGGGYNGKFYRYHVTTIAAAIRANQFSAYQGIVFDIEEAESGLTGLFQETFALAKHRGLQVLVTVSHSAPYGIPDAAYMMRAFFQDEHIDFISPQLYTTGEEVVNDYEITAGVSWTEYARCKAKIIPSIVHSGLYDDAKVYFADRGVTLGGYVQWQQPK